MRAVLFDVDGTLIRLDGTGKRSLGRAFVESFDVSQANVDVALERVDFRGNTDLAIVDQIAGDLGLPLVEIAKTVMPTYLNLLERAVREDQGRKMPGIDQLIARLDSMGTQVGLLTGNFRDGARVKLEPHGLYHLASRLGGFGDDAERREQIARIAVDRLLGAGVGSPSAVWVIGDTIRDVQAAHAAGARAVAVATGWTPRSELESTGAELILDDLSDVEGLLAQLAQPSP